MVSTYDQHGRQIPVTIVAAGNNVVLGTKGDRATLGFGQKKKSKKTENAFIKSVGYSPRFIKEVSFKTQEEDKTPQSSEENSKSENQISTGDKITVSIFDPGDLVKVSGTTKGKGFAGGVKRHGFAGGPKTHGQSDRHRAPGSIGAGTTPGRVFKGKRMAGHMGNAKLTVVNLEIVEADPTKGLLYIKGSIPGADGGFLTIEKTGKAKNYASPPSPNEEKQAEKEAKAEEEAKTATTKDTDIKDEDTVKNPASNNSESKQTVVAKEEKENADK